MHLFVATPAAPGSDDFSWTVPGELVHFPPIVCDCPDCGCERTMCGLASHKATSSFVVRDLDLDAATFTQLMWESLEAGGWVEKGNQEDRQWVEEWAAEHIDVAADFPVDTPLRLHNYRISIRNSATLR